MHVHVCLIKLQSLVGVGVWVCLLLTHFETYPAIWISSANAMARH